jgi:hypothetical protein
VFFDAIPLPGVEEVGMVGLSELIGFSTEWLGLVPAGAFAKCGVAAGFSAWQVF